LLHLWLLFAPWLWSLRLARLLDLLTSCVIGLLPPHPLLILWLSLLDFLPCLILPLLILCLSLLDSLPFLILPLALPLLIALVLLLTSDIARISRTIIPAYVIRTNTIRGAIIIVVDVWPPRILIPRLVRRTRSRSIARLIIRLPLSISRVTALVP